MIDGILIESLALIEIDAGDFKLKCIRAKVPEKIT